MHEAGADICGERAREHVARLCYPRRVGSTAERWAADYVAQHMEELDLAARRQPFPLADTSWEWLNRAILACCAAIAIVGALAFPVWPIISALAWASVAMLVNLPWRWAGRGNRFVSGGRLWSENIVAIPRRNRPGRVRVVFMAHYDTKSQVIPTGLRVGLVTTVWCCSWLLAALTVLWCVGYWPSWLPASPNPWNLTIAIVICLAGLVANFSGNRSPGALDNGSGVAALLELARLWQQVSRQAGRWTRQLEVVFVATSAEETDLEGARHFLSQHAHWWSEKPTLLINLESVGAGPKLYLSGEANTLLWAESICRELGLQPKRLRVLGAGMDHQPFAAQGLTCISILGDVVRRCFHLHTLRDDLRLIETDALERAIRLAWHLTRRWVEIHTEVSTESAARPLARLPVVDSQLV
ncbi:MAG: M28 family peptidase [Gemmatales bacterium]|nr:M28 family metallopeptidase [Gemmatales bacterium]MCS7159974.1 M28 family metallopeptidase [Gemmatales bacterium]MDW8175173.1 M28 family peptidase [Gemmatales bacterium]MDW8223916.1 M28 family peptidase [Gemmatales bacterium]